MKTMNLFGYYIVCVVGFFFLFAFPAYSESFHLLEESQEGVGFYRNPCRSDAFSLVFSFSEDLKDLSKESFILVNFSKDFQDFLTAHDQVKEVDLFYSQSQKIGNRQLRIDYVARKPLPNGTFSQIEMPDQIEVVLLEKGFSRILDMHDQRCVLPETFKRKLTLINKNTDQKCSQLE